MASRARIIDQDLGWRKIKRALERSRDATVVTIGVHEDAASRKDGDGISGVVLAAVHEFGRRDGSIPERSFIRSTIDDNARKYSALTKNMLLRIMRSGMTSHHALGLLGARVVADIKRRIQHGIAPDIQEATKQRKGSSKPLIDTAQLLRSITHVVRRRGT